MLNIIMIVFFYLIRNIYMNGIFYIKLYMNMNIFFRYLYLLLFYLYKKREYNFNIKVL